jgi:ribosomal protein S21
MIEVKVRKSEPIDYALKRLRSKTEKESLMDDVRRKRFHENKAQKKKRKARKKPLNIEWNIFPRA